MWIEHFGVLHSCYMHDEHDVEDEEEKKKTKRERPEKRTAI